MPETAYRLASPGGRTVWGWHLLAVGTDLDRGEPSPLFYPVEGGRPTAPLRFVEEGRLVVDETKPLPELVEELGGQ